MELLPNNAQNAIRQDKKSERAHFVWLNKGGKNDNNIISDYNIVMFSVSPVSSRGEE